MPEEEERIPVDVSVLFREGIEEVLSQELDLIESILPELLKIMLEEMANEEE